MASYSLKTSIIVTLVLVGPLSSFAAPLGSAMTYQGFLKDAGSPANGPHTMRFKLFDAAVGGSQVGLTLTFDGVGGNPPQVAVTSGLFTVELDFGASTFRTGERRWLEISVNGNLLNARQEITPAPYSRFSAAPWATSGTTINYSTGDVGIGGSNTLQLGTGIPGQEANAGKIGYERFSPDALDIVGAGTNASNRKIKFHSEGGSEFTGNGFFNGNLGIGIAAPTARLHTSGGTAFNHARIESNNNLGTWLNLKSTDIGGREWAFVSSASSNVEGAGKLLIQDRFASLIRMTIDTAGNVGIGNTSPDAPLSFNNTVGEKISLYDSGSTSYGLSIQPSLLEIHTDAVTSDVAFGHGNTGSLIENMRIKGTGNVGIGSSAPNARLHVVGGPAFNQTRVESSDTGGTWLNIQNTGASGREWALVSTGAANGEGPGKLLVIDRTSGTPRMLVDASGNVGIGTTTPASKLDVIGVTRTQVLQITGGADIAEPFDVREADETRPGMVLCIDSQKVGELKLASKPYDRAVAGVVSGANGVMPGMVLQQHGKAEADGKYPIALTGRVWVFADADAGGEIAAGDLLTTSSTVGHAMKVSDHSRANGAILGKAMSSLKRGRGMVLVLVGLQ